jgi:mannose-6-phosphate isomerase-like protein (cupin superfamily)
MIEIRKKEIVPIKKKGWGEEVYIENNDMYCGKLLRFKDGAEFSFHYHLEKTETWYVNSGMFVLKYYNLNDGELLSEAIHEGDVVHIPAGTPHKLICLRRGEIFEVSTSHYDDDSYRIEKGDSQK